MSGNKHIIYQTFPRLFGNFNSFLVKGGGIEVNGCGKFDSYTPKALDEIRDLGISHIWYMGVIAHSTRSDYQSYGIRKDHNAIVKGKAGSPFAIRDYYDVDPDLAVNVPNRMAEFENLVKRTHDAGMKVIIDFVPNHVARSYHSLMKPSYTDDLGQHDDTTKSFSPSNNFYYLPGQNLTLHFGAKEEDYEYSEFPAKVTGNDCFSASPNKNDWYETVKLNYGIDYQNGKAKYFNPVPDTWHKMLEILLFWTEKDVDGFRCDMVEMVPAEFWHWAIPRVKERKNVEFIAEVYNPALYRDYIHIGRFDYLYDKVGMYDTMRRIIRREAPTTDITILWQQTEDIRENMLYFLENHDEQRIASDYFADHARLGLPGLVCLATLNANPLMIYNGQELGEKGMDREGFSGLDGRTSIFDYWSMESVRRWANSGAFNGGQLSAEQRQIRDYYRKIINIAVNEKAISEGSFYDLAYCNNSGNPCFPADRMMAYLRKAGDELLLILINFDDREHNVRVNIPQNAFDVMKIADNRASRVTELISGEESIFALTPVCPYGASVSAHSAGIYKFEYLQ
ncbi:MAG: alpha-amylase family protein [Tannerella sp.]|jgi:glycosidase|nr:alpha-amylase family protein [Tannerella sp.]